MSITDELREYIRREMWDLPKWKDELQPIADRIDAAHRSALEKLAAQLDESGALPMTNENMAGHGWVRLPVDADGVPIRVGDVMDVGIVFAIGDDGVFMVENGFSGKYDVECFDGFACHHRAPTVEDVLREFAERYLDYEGMQSAGRRGVGEALMDEFAAKLRLAGDE